MQEPERARPALGAYRDLVAALSGDGWTHTSFEQRNLRTDRLTSPGLDLRATLDYDAISGVFRARLGTVPDSPGEPAHWYAAADDPPPALWREAARSAARAAWQEPYLSPSFHPGAVLQNFGWEHRRLSHERRSADQYTCPETGRQLTYKHPVRSLPALWTITRPETSIGIAVIAADPYALPALVLALSLGAPDGTMPTL